MGRDCKCDYVPVTMLGFLSLLVSRSLLVFLVVFVPVLLVFMLVLVSVGIWDNSRDLLDTCLVAIIPNDRRFAHSVT